MRAIEDGFTQDCRDVSVKRLIDRAMTRQIQNRIGIRDTAFTRWIRDVPPKRLCGVDS